MIERWKKKKLRMLDLEPAGPFADAAFAQDDDLLAAPQRIHHDGPFFERNPHGQRLNAQNSFGNLSSGCGQLQVVRCGTLRLRWALTRSNTTDHGQPTTRQRALCLPPRAHSPRLLVKSIL